jgi:hypothetical protein
MAKEVVERAESGEKRGEESQRKGKISKTACAETQRADKDSVYSAAPAFNWAEDVDASISTIQVVDGGPTPLANVNTSDDVSPIAHIETTPITSIKNTLIDLNTTAIPIPRDLSGLHFGTLNPWESLHRCCCGCYPHATHQFTHQKQHLLIYPVNTYLHTATIPKPPISTPICVLEMIQHLYRIGPTKPVIRVPVLTAAETLIYICTSWPELV